MDKVQCIHRGKHNLSINKWSVDRYSSIDQSWKHYVNEKEKDSDSKVLCHHLTFFFYQKQTNFIDIESRLMVMTF